MIHKKQIIGVVKYIKQKNNIKSKKDVPKIKLTDIHNLGDLCLRAMYTLDSIDNQRIANYVFGYLKECEQDNENQNKNN